LLKDFYSFLLTAIIALEELSEHNYTQITELTKACKSNHFSSLSAWIFFQGFIWMFNCMKLIMS